jgi:tetratricopeptide (TPR) repeat protein
VSTTHSQRLPRPSAALAIVLALGAAIAIWMRPTGAGFESVTHSAPSPAPPAPAPETAPALAPRELDAARTRGLAHAELAEDAATLDELVAVYRARPEDDTVAIAIAEASLRKRDLKTAEVVLAALRAPDAPEALRVRAVLFEQADRLPEALALYERAIPQLARPEPTLEARARVLSWLGRFDEAAAGYGALAEDARASVEQKRRCRVRLAELRAWKKDLDGALGQLAGVLSEEPARADALLLQGQILEWQGRYADAKRSYSALLAADANHAEARLRLDKLLWVR